LPPPIAVCAIIAFDVTKGFDETFHACRGSDKRTKLIEDLEGRMGRMELNLSRMMELRCAADHAKLMPQVAGLTHAHTHARAQKHTPRARAHIQTHDTRTLHTHTHTLTFHRLRARFFTPAKEMIAICLVLRILRDTLSSVQSL
jgi:hypothetical protein